jgi:hypothetical protein
MRRFLALTGRQHGLLSLIHFHVYPFGMLNLIDLNAQLGVRPFMFQAYHFFISRGYDGHPPTWCRNPALENHDVARVSGCHPAHADQYVAIYLMSNAY